MRARLHPLTGQPLAPIGVFGGRTVWPIIGGSQTVVDPGPPSGPPSPPPAGDQGFPANTPVADMAPEQQVAYWKAQARKHEGRATERQDYDQVKAELEKARSANQSESEKAIAAAKAEGKAEAATEVNNGAAAAILDAQLRMRGRTDDQIAGQLKYVDPAKFVTNGQIDTKAIADYVDSIAGPVTGSSTTPDFGAGNRGSQTTVSGKAAGLAEAEKRFAKKQ